MTRARLLPWLGLLLAAGCQETGGPSAAGGVRLSLQLARALSGETLEVQPSYRRASQAVVTLPLIRIGLQEAASQTVTVEVDIAACLADDAREGGGPGCPLRLELTLRSAADELLDTATLGPLDAMPGAALSVPAVTLHHITTINLSAPSQTLTMGAPVQVTAQVTDRANAAITGRTLDWSSSNSAVATVDQAGLVTPIFPGQVQIRAILDGHPFGPQGSITLTVVSPASALIGPAGGSVISADGTLTVGIPPGALAAPTTVSIADLTLTDSDRVIAGRLYQLLPAGLTLAVPANLIIQFNPAAIPGGARNETALRLFFVSAGDSVAQVVSGSGVNIALHRVTGAISQFGYVGAAVAAVGVRSLAVGDQHACVALTTGQGMCWGAGIGGSLGWGINDGSSDPVFVTGTQNWATMAAGGNFSCGLTTAGQVWCWGANNLGQLGNGGTSNALAPVAVTIPGTVTALEAGWDSACAADQGQRVWCWGSNFRGQLGVTTTATCGTTPCSTVPVQLPPAVTATAMSFGFQNVCAVSGAFQGCWGSNLGGALGLSGGAQQSQAAVPPPAGAPGPFTKLAPGAFHSCGILADGSAWCWGSNSEGRMGTGTVSSPTTFTPVPVAGGLSFSQMDVGSPNSTVAPSCGVTTGGAGYCWGSNSRGQLGTTAGGLSTCGFGPCTGTPLPVAGGLNFREIHGGTNFACGFLATGAPQVWCWGGNNNGQLGVGDHADKATPKRVP